MNELYGAAIRLLGLLLLAQWTIYIGWAIVLNVRQTPWRREVSRRVLVFSGAIGTLLGLLAAAGTLAIETERPLPYGWVTLLVFALAACGLPWLNGVAVAALVRWASAMSGRE